MALEVHLTDRDVGLATAGLFNENKWEEIFRGLMTLAGGQGAIPGFVLTGLDQNAVSGLNFTFNAGDAVISGFPVKNFPQTQITLPASQSNINVYLELTKDGGGDISGAQLTTKTDFTLPTNPAILLRYFKTDATSITTNSDRRGRSSRVYTTRYTGDSQSPRTIMLGFTPRFLAIFSEPTAGTDVRLRLATFFDGTADGVLLVDDTGAGVTNLDVNTGAVIVNGGLVVTSPLNANSSGIEHYLAAW